MKNRIAATTLLFSSFAAWADRYGVDDGDRSPVDLGGMLLVALAAGAAWWIWKKFF